MADLGAPVVAKVLDPSITHKADVGGVQTGLFDAGMLVTALDGFVAAGLDTDHVLIEEQVGPGPELIVGAIRDPVFGPTVMLGLGGTLAELAPPVAMRLAPLSTEDLAEMVRALPDQVRHPRHGPVMDDAPVARAIAVVGALVVEHDAIESVEINPLRVTVDGLIALDAVIGVQG